MDTRFEPLKQTIKESTRTIVELSTDLDIADARKEVTFGTDKIDSLITKQGTNYILQLGLENTAPIEFPVIENIAQLPDIEGAVVNIKNRRFEVKAVKLGLGIVIYTTEIFTEEYLPQAA